MKLKKILLNLFLLILSALIIIGGIIVFQGYQMYQAALGQTSVEDMADNVRSQPGFTPLEELPELYLEAVVAVEDQRFYEHGGVDLIAILRAVWNDLRSFSLAEGGSTITQQVAKNLYFTQERTATRKIAEILMARQLEKHLDKDEILELYVNSIYFGNGYYQVSAACEGYFHKQPKDMTDSECTMLAGIPNAPSVYAPTVNPDLAVKRQKKVLSQMVDQGFLSEEEASEILGQE